MFVRSVFLNKEVIQIHMKKGLCALNKVGKLAQSVTQPCNIYISLIFIENNWVITVQGLHAFILANHNVYKKKKKKKKKNGTTHAITATRLGIVY